MKITRWITRLFVVAIALFTMLAAQAAVPVWTFTPLTPTTLFLPSGSSATIQYTVTNKSKRSHTLVMTPITGISQTTTSGNCSNPFTLSYQQSCTLTLQVTGSALAGNVTSGPVVCDHGNALECYQPSLANSINITVTNTTTIAANLSNLGLSVNNPGLNAALTGNPRNFTITNTGTLPAQNVSYSISPALPAGTTVSPANCGTMPVGAVCTLIITPGAAASSATNVITVQGSNTNATTTNVNILSYGSNYESGLVFSIDDSYADFPATGSVGGKAAALADQVAPALGIVWSSNPVGTYDGGVSIWGIDETSMTATPSPNAGSGQPATLVPGQSNCNGATVGSCDSTNILAFYSPPTTSPAITASFYAAGVCSLAISGMSDWYLPSICEEGYDATAAGSTCGTLVAPTLQNMQSNLVDNATPGAPSGLYWSSTEFSGLPQNNAWLQDFATGGGTIQADVSKGDFVGVRCARALN